AWLRSSPTELNDLWVRDGQAGAPCRLTDLNRDALAEVELREPVERRVTVDGREIQGWFLAAARDATRHAKTSRRPGPGPLVTEIHGGPHTFYGWTPVLEFHLLAAAGMHVFFCN